MRQSVFFSCGNLSLCYCTQRLYLTAAVYLYGMQERWSLRMAQGNIPPYTCDRISQKPASVKEKFLLFGTRSPFIEKFPLFGNVFPICQEVSVVWECVPRSSKRFHRPEYAPSEYSPEPGGNFFFAAGKNFLLRRSGNCGRIRG